MVLPNLKQSGFRKLKLIKPARDSTNYDSGYHDLEKVLLQSLGKVEPRKLDPSQLLTKPSVVLPINKYINKELDSVSSEKKKNAVKSTEYRTRGNQEYRRGHLSQAAYYFTMAIIYAPDVAEKVDDNVDHNVDKKVPEEELFLAYGNRSAVFYELGQYEAALADIDHSLATGYPREKQPKLLLRKVECLISLMQFGEAKRVWEQLCSITEPKDERALEIRLQLFKMNSNDHNTQPQPKLSPTDQLFPIINYLTRTRGYQPSPDASSLSAKVERQYWPTSKGRHLVAKQDIEPGDILMVESPFASVLKRDFEYHFCHHCCRKLESKIDGESDELCITGSLVPCTECTRVLYCSTDCRTKAWRTYHQYECSILPILYQMPYISHLSLRMLFATGLDVIQQMSNQNEDDEFKDPRFEDTSSRKLSYVNDIAAKHYELVHSLIDPLDSIPRDDLAEFVIASTVLVQLAKKCAFIRTSKQAKSTANILYRHLRQLHSTMIDIDCSVGSFRNQNPSTSLYNAVGCYPYEASLMNHSCEPNLVSSFVQSTVMVHRASKKILAGTEVTATYGYYGFTEQELTARRNYLLNVYHFECECTRCVIEERDGLNGMYFPIGCKDCGSTLTRESSESATFYCSSPSCAAGPMFLFKAEQLYDLIEIKLAIVTSLIENFENGAPVESHFVLECQKYLSELSEIPGLRNCWQLGELHRRLSDAVSTQVHLLLVARQHFERYCEINLTYSGLARALTNYRKLILLYIADAADADNGQDYGQADYLMVQKCRIIVNRTLGLVRLELLANVEPPPTDRDGLDDLLVEESRHLRKIYKDLMTTFYSVKK